MSRFTDRWEPHFGAEPSMVGNEHTLVVTTDIDEAEISRILVRDRDNGTVKAYIERGSHLLPMLATEDIVNTYTLTHTP